MKQHRSNLLPEDVFFFFFEGGGFAEKKSGRKGDPDAQLVH